MMRAALYTRLSRFIDTSTSLERQTQDGEALIASLSADYEPARDHYEDNDLSAFRPGVVRPSMDRLEANLSNYDVLIFWKVDRVFRNLLEAAGFFQRCKDAGVVPHSVKEGEFDLHDPMRTLFALFPAAQGEQESRNTSQRVSSAMEYLRSHGYWSGGEAPYGYKLVPAGEHTRLSIEPDEAERLRDAAERIIGGESVGAVVRAWNEEGHRTRRGNLWRAPNLSKLLRKHVLAGFSTYEGRIERDEDGEPVTLTDEPVLTPGRHRALVAELDRRSRTYPRTRHETLLGGILVCAECGTSMGGSRRAGYKYQGVYQCLAAHRGIAECPGNTVSMPYTEEYVTEFVIGYHEKAGTLARAAEEAAPEGEPGQEAKAEVERLETLLALHVEDREAYPGPEGAKQWRARNAELIERLEAARRAWDEAVAIPDVPDEVGDVDTLRERWGHLSTAERKTIVRATIERIDVVKGTRGGSQRGDNLSRGVVSRLTIHPRA